MVVAAAAVSLLLAQEVAVADLRLFEHQQEEVGVLFERYFYFYSYSDKSSENLCKAPEEVNPY